MLIDEELMLKAIALAEQALLIGEVPVGAIITDGCGNIIGSGFNQCEKRGNPLAHAEIIAIETILSQSQTRAAVQRALPVGRQLDGDQTGQGNPAALSDCTIYVTLEPCLMCAGAIMQVRLKRIVYGAYSDKGGALSSIANVYEHRFGYKPMVRGGILESECAALMNRFGGNLR